MIPYLIPSKYRKPVRLAQLTYCPEQLRLAPTVLQSHPAPLVIGPLADPVFVYLRSNFPGHAHFVRWEDYLETWDCGIQDGVLDLRSGGRVHGVTSVYVRAPEVSREYVHRERLRHLMLALCASRQRRLGTPDLGVSNFSKFHQLHSVIRRAASGLSTVAIPETAMVKSFSMNGPALARWMGPSVAKGLSSVRTEVFDDRRFRHFTRHRPADVPVLLQKRIRGLEIRVHSLLGRTFPLGIRKLSDKVDYRYDCEVELIHDIELTPDEETFCRRLHALDGNPLIGVDLIRAEGITYCFEANPNPGWACFDYRECTKALIGRAILDHLDGR